MRLFSQKYPVVCCNNCIRSINKTSPMILDVLCAVRVHDLMLRNATTVFVFLFLSTHRAPEQKISFDKPHLSWWMWVAWRTIRWRELISSSCHIIAFFTASSLTSAGRIHNKFNYDLWQRRSSDINSVDSYSSSQKTTIERFDELRDTKFSIRPTQIHCPFHSFALE